MVRDVHVGVKCDDGRMVTIPSCLQYHLVSSNPDDL